MRRHSLSSAITLLSLFVAIADAQQNTGTAAGVIAQLRQGDNQAALSLASKALQSNPHDCRLLSLKAVAQGNLNQQQPALASFQKALAVCPTYLPALEGAAQIEYKNKDAGVLVLLNRIIALQPANATAHAMTASVLQGKGQCPEALPHYQAGAALLSVQRDFRQGYGFCLAQTGDLQAALVQYEALLTVDPNENTRYNVALLQWKLHDNAAALQTLAPLLTEANNVRGLALGSKISEENGDTPKAVELLRAAILLNPDDVDNYLAFASIAFNHKSLQVGIDMLNAGLTRLPNAAPLYLARGVLKAQLTSSEGAIADFEQAHRLDPKLSFAVDALGIMQSQQHQGAQSLALFRSEAKLHPEDPLLQYLLAERLSQSDADTDSENLREAIEAAKKATVLDPKYQPAHDLLAVLYIRTQQPKLAIQQAEMALALDPDDQTALFQELMALRRTGDTTHIESLTSRLNQVRKENGRKQQVVDRYRLQD